MDPCDDTTVNCQCPPTEVCTIYQCWALDPNGIASNDQFNQAQCQPCPSTENYRPPSLAQQGLIIPPGISSRGGKYRDDTPKTINMGFLNLSKPVFNKQNRTTNSRGNDATDGGGGGGRSRKGAKPISLGRRPKNRVGSKSRRRPGKSKTRAASKRPGGGGASKPRRAASRSQRKGRSKSKKSSKGRSGSDKRSKSGAGKSKGSKKGKNKGSPGSKSRGRSPKKSRSKSGSSKSKSKSSSKSSSRSRGASKDKKKQRGRSKQKSGRRKPRGPPPTPVNVDERKTQSLRVSRLERLNMYRFLNGAEEPSRMTELRGYTSEPEMKIPFELKFELRKGAPKSPTKCKSMEDVLLGNGDHQDLVVQACQSEDVLDGADLNISPSCWNKWRDLFQMEKDRYSFYDQLYLKKYITDSMEVPSVPDDVSYLIEADDEHFRTKIDYGRIVLKTKHVYTGNFYDWYFHGPGRYVWLDGKVYQGDFVNGVMHGEGTFVWPDGSIYEGEFREGVRKGQGLYSTPQGYIYSGEWNEGIPHGRGKVWYDTEGNDFYEGGIDNGFIHGFGTRHYKNGDQYVGHWHYGKQEGAGTMLWRSLNQMYRGHWLHGKPHGEGIQVWYEVKEEDTDGAPTKTQNWRNIFKGRWNNGLRHGTGKLFFPNGAIYEGIWQNGKQMEGDGKYLDPTGELLLELACIQRDEAGFMEEILDRHIFECLFSKLVDTIGLRFAVRREECGVTEAQVLADVCFKYMPELQLLYKRAGVLGTIWSGNCESPQATTKDCKNCFPTMDTFNVNENGNMRRNIYAELNRKMAPEKFPVTRLGLWLFVADCENALRHVTMAYYDKIWCTTPSICFQSPYSPFETVHFWQFIQCLIMVAFEMAVGIPFDRSRIKYKCTKEDAELSVGTMKEEKIINCKNNEEDNQSKDGKRKKGSKKNAGGKKGNEDGGGGAKKRSKGKKALAKEKEKEKKASTPEPPPAPPPTKVPKEVEDALKVNLSDDDFIDLPPADDGALARPPSALIEADAQAQTETGELPGEKESSEEDIFEPDDKIKCAVWSVGEIFDKFISECLIKCFDRLPGRLLPELPNPRPSAVNLYEDFYAIAKTPTITGIDFLRSVLATEVHPPSDIFWIRSKDLLAVHMDYKHLLNYAQKLSIITQSRLLLEPLDISESESEISLVGRRTRSRSRPKMYTRDFAYSAASIQPVPSLQQGSQLNQRSREVQAIKSSQRLGLKSKEAQALKSSELTKSTEAPSKSTEQKLKESQPPKSVELRQKSELQAAKSQNFNSNVKSAPSEAVHPPADQQSNLVQPSVVSLEPSRAIPNHTPDSAEASIEYCLPMEEETSIPEEPEAVEEPKRLEIFDQENIFDIEQELLQPDGRSYYDKRSSSVTETPEKPPVRTNLTSEDVIKVLRKLYPEMCGSEEPANITFEMTFCDWLWATLLCAQVSAEKYTVTSERPTRPTTFKRLSFSRNNPLTPPNTSVIQCDFCYERGDTAKTFQEIILPAFMRHEQLRMGDVAITKSHGTRGFQPVENRHLHSRAGYGPPSAPSSRKSVAL